MKDSFQSSKHVLFTIFTSCKLEYPLFNRSNSCLVILFAGSLDNQSNLFEEDSHFGRGSDGKHQKNHVSKPNINKQHSRPTVLGKRSLQHRRNLTHWCQRTVDAFELLAQIGEGTYGQVYKAKDTSKSKICFRFCSSMFISALQIVFFFNLVTVRTSSVT